MATATAPEVRGNHSPVPEREDISYRAAVAAAGLALGLLGTDAGAGELAPWTGGPKPPLALDHGRVQLADREAPVVVAHFFATWCEPCVREMASLEVLALRRAGEVEILAVDVGEVDARVRRFFAERPVSFPVLLDRDRSATRGWEVVALPTSFVLDARGRPVLFVEGELDWDAPETDARLDAVIGTAPGGTELQTREVETDDEPT